MRIKIININIHFSNWRLYS